MEGGTAGPAAPRAAGAPTEASTGGGMLRSVGRGGRDGAEAARRAGRRRRAGAGRAGAVRRCSARAWRRRPRRARGVRTRAALRPPAPRSCATSWRSTRARTSCWGASRWSSRCGAGDEAAAGRGMAGNAAARPQVGRPRPRPRPRARGRPKRVPALARRRSATAWPRRPRPRAAPRARRPRRRRAAGSRRRRRRWRRAACWRAWSSSVPRQTHTGGGSSGARGGAWGPACAGSPRLRRGWVLGGQRAAARPAEASPGPTAPSPPPPPTGRSNTRRSLRTRPSTCASGSTTPRRSCVPRARPRPRPRHARRGRRRGSRRSGWAGRRCRAWRALRSS
jgi:hypothetical protein